MELDFGFVSICLSEHNCSPAGSVTVTAAAKLADAEARIRKFKKVALKNLLNTKRIMFFNKAHSIGLYRFASQLIPLATHEYTDGWQWWEDTEIEKDLQGIGKLIAENGFKVSTHPPQVCVFNGEQDGSFEWVRRYLRYHNRLLDCMGLDAASKIVFHVGKGYENPKEGLKRAVDNFHSLPEHQRSRIILENDDTTYTAAQVLQLCLEIGVPMVLDIHHHWCRNDGENIEELLPQIFATWRGQKRPPKIHVSTPKNERKFRDHAEYIDTERVAPLIKKALSIGPFDIMIEAKAKDKALLKFRSELAGYLL